ncbi:hypothetical protein PTKIN_Ptkin12aG0157300 [Pterospermum kingtungense]
MNKTAAITRTRPANAMLSLSPPRMATGFAVTRCHASAYQRAVPFLSRPQRFHSLSSRTAESRFLKLNNNLGRNCSSLSNAPFVVADDKKYGNKQVISITPRLYDYILANVREPQILRQLREETANMRGSQMQVSPDQAQLLAMLVQILGAERCIELGVYTGYSSLAIALALPESGILVACERDARSLDVAKKYYELAGVSHKVIVKHGLAAAALQSMILNGEACSYDFAFVDAEKRMNQEYFELLLQLVRVGGVIVIDNVLWHGKVADPLVNDAKTVSIRNFNRNLMEDNRVNISMAWCGAGPRTETCIRLALNKLIGCEVNRALQEAAAQAPGRSLFGYNSALVQILQQRIKPIQLYTQPFPSLEPLVAASTTSLDPGLPLPLAAPLMFFMLALSFTAITTKTRLFLVIAGALLGFGAGLLWAGQGAIMTSYPTPARKATYISLFWSIFNLGGVIGGLIPFILNYHRAASETVNDNTYITFMCFMSAALISFSILSPDRIVRDDGTRCTNIKHSNVTTEAIGIIELLSNWKLLIIAPAVWASNFFYTYQFSNVNGLMFNLRTRGLNNAFYWGAHGRFNGNCMYSGLVFQEQKNKRSGWSRNCCCAWDCNLGWWPCQPIELFSSQASQAVIGALADNSETLSRYTGFYKGVQSAGSAVAFQVDENKVPLLNQLIVTWVVTTLSYPLLEILVYWAVKDDTKSAEDADIASDISSASVKDGDEECGKSMVMMLLELLNNLPLPQ